MLVQMDSDCAAFRSVEKGPPAQRRAAQQLLYERHGRYLLGVFRGRARRLLALSPMNEEDLLHETFFRAFERAQAYRCLETTESEEEQRRTRAWLGRIAQRLLADSLSQQKERPTDFDMEELVDEGPPSSGSGHAALLRSIVQGLSEREQDILRVTALYLRVGETHQRLPNEVAQELARRWDISPENLRAIRKRALSKVREQMLERLGQAELEGRK